MSGKLERTVRAVVVGRHSAGEGSLKIVLYTDALGLVYAFAKSACEERSKLRAHLVEGTRGIFTLVRGAGFWRITGAVATENAYFAIASSRALDAKSGQEVVARVVGVIRHFVRGEGSNPYLFEALWGFLAAAPRLRDDDVRAAEALAVLKIMAALGYVHADSMLQKFLEAPYEHGVLVETRTAWPLIVGAINEGIAVSHL